MDVSEEDTGDRVKCNIVRLGWSTSNSLERKGRLGVHIIYMYIFTYFGILSIFSMCYEFHGISYWIDKFDIDR